MTGATAAIATAGYTIGFSATSVATGLALGGRPHRSLGARSSKTRLRSGRDRTAAGSTCGGSGTTRLGRIRRGSAAGARGSAGGGQDTAGRGTVGAVAR